MKIAIYYPWVYLKSGVERTILESVSGGSDDYTIFTNHYDREATYPEIKKLKIVELKRISVQRNIINTLKSAFIIAFQKIDLSGFDAVIVHSEGLGDLFLVRNHSKPAICFCHTPLRPVFDTEYKMRALERKSVFQKGIYFVFEKTFKFFDRRLWKKYKYIVFNSKETLKRACDGGLIGNSAKYTVLHPGIYWGKIKPSWKYDKYFLIPGRIMWTKNIELAIQSFKLFAKSRGGYKLIIAGMLDKKSQSYYRKLKGLAAYTKDIVFFINPSDQKLDELYSNCYTSLAMSFNEDWGLTPIEANAFGKPVIAVNRGGYKESQINGKTGYLINLSAKDIAQKMDYLSKNPDKVKKMGMYAREQSKQFSSKHFIKRLEEVTNLCISQESSYSIKTKSL